MTLYRWPVLVGLAALFAALLAAIIYTQHGLALSHYDARAHLVVARRILDSLTPGWWQIGAVWLPLPHVINLLPVQWDWSYRTGASAIAFSVVSMGVAAYAAAHLLQRATGSRLAGAATAALLVTNASVLYLHATPMTEPLLIALAFVSVERLDAWLRDPDMSTVTPGLALVLLCLTRYEGWMLTAAALAIVALTLVLGAWSGIPSRRRGEGAPKSGRACDLLTPSRMNAGHRACAWAWVRLALWPAAAVIGFLCLSRATVGEWFVSSGFFVPDNPAKGEASLVLEQIRDGLERLSSPAFAAFGGLGFVFVLARGLASRADRSILVVLSLAAMAALPFLAFHAGHPLRIRYMTPLVASSALFTGFAIGLTPPLARVVVAAVAAILIVPDLEPFDYTAPMIVEARREGPQQGQRRMVTDALKRQWDGTPILISMGSLAHYMHDLGREGFDIGDFIHEGNGDIWEAAIVDPSTQARFLIAEERAEGGDVFAHLLRDRSDVAAKFERIAAGGNVSLYRRIW
ncbi:MAG: hypothetical protein WD690_18140 [Vicinamibacterales bacterium]